MNLDTGSVLNFSPVDPELWEVAFTGETESWNLPVLGFAVVITYGGGDSLPSDSKLLPVVICDEGFPTHVYEYLGDWDNPRPTWALKRKQETPQQTGTCPACGKATLYDVALDRHVHTDGSPSRECRLRTTRGEV